ncbi:hypothetical protein CYMTET_24811 [Cymbomonas tetramitiformis]|uniref:Uncharacterized protein n=1 Tax=Cymbomonas tetramitiformis TaxID=36881 RepID=A0AAE0KZI8_9CHLO|nr:hypothetical protein CYMTET_24811 [Cymbomonas tetramitiformis]
MRGVRPDLFESGALYFDEAVQRRLRQILGIPLRLNEELVAVSQVPTAREVSSATELLTTVKDGAIFNAKRDLTRRRTSCRFAARTPPVWCHDDAVGFKGDFAHQLDALELAWVQAARLKQVAKKSLLATIQDKVLSRRSWRDAKAAAEGVVRRMAALAKQEDEVRGAHLPKALPPARAPFLAHPVRST